MPLHRVRSIISPAEAEMSFFERIEKWHSRFSPEYEMIQRAYRDARDAFIGIHRDEGGEYFSHVRAVAIILMDYLYLFERCGLKIPPHEILVAALIHDNCEDRPEMWDLNRVEDEYTKNIALLLDYVSKKPRDQFGGSKILQDKHYHGRFPTAPYEFFLIKLADRLHNLLTIWTDITKKTKIFYKMSETERYYLPYARAHGILAHEIDGALIELREKYPDYKPRN